RDRAVVFGAHHAPPTMLTGDEPPLAVPRVAVSEVRRFAEDADRAGLFFPLDDALVGDVAAKQISPVAEPYRAFRPAQPRAEPFLRRPFQPVFFEAPIERMDRGIGIMGRRPPSGRIRCIGHLLFSLLRFLADCSAITPGERPQIIAK